MEFPGNKVNRVKREFLTTENRIDLAQVKVDKDVLELERSLGSAIEDISRSVSCVREEMHMNSLAHKVERYTTFIRDILALAEPQSIPGGIRLHNILDENLVQDVMNSIDVTNETIYYNDSSIFFTWARGFISQLVYVPEANIVTMKIRIQIPLAYWEDVIPTYMVYQIGFIPSYGGPCSKLILPNILARKNGTFYEFKCQSDSCMDGHLASTAHSCLNNGSNISCPIILSHCKQVSTFIMDYGILLTTNHDIFTVNVSGHRTKLINNGSVLIPWRDLSMIEVEGKFPINYHKVFHSPTPNVTLKSETIPNSDVEDMKYSWLEIFHANQSLENDIMRKTVSEVQLIKKEVISKKIHLSVWASVAFFIVTCIIILVTCWSRNFRNTVFVQTSSV